MEQNDHHHYTAAAAPLFFFWVSVDRTIQCPSAGLPPPPPCVICMLHSNHLPDADAVPSSTPSCLYCPSYLNSVHIKDYPDLPYIFGLVLRQREKERKKKKK